VAVLCSAGFDSAGFDRCAISFVCQQTWQVFKSKLSQQQPSVCDCGNRLAISKPGARARRQLQADLLK
jgi:hypothetical protein